MRPIHNEVPPGLRPVMRLGWARLPSAAMRGLARSAGVPRTSVRWRKLGGPYFGNAVGTLLHTGGNATVTIEGTNPEGELHTVVHQPLTEGDR